MKIRRATVADAKNVAELGRETFWNAHEAVVPEADLSAYLDQAFSLERVTSELSNTANIFHLAEDGGRAVGYSKIIHDFSHDLINRADVTKLERIYFLPSHHGTGAAQELFALNQGLARAKRQSGIWLTVWVGNERAIGFYGRNGFKSVGETLFKIGGIAHPNYVMLSDPGPDGWDA